MTNALIFDVSSICLDDYSKRVVEKLIYNVYTAEQYGEFDVK